jgi:pimeloyl-ACP methyl ester carboxylesterase
MKRLKKIQILPLILLIFTNLSCALLAPSVQEARGKGQIDLRPCRSPHFSGELLCGKHTVYENRSAGQGRMIDLNILILPALAPDPAPDPIFFLAGGPGQGAARIARASEDPLMRALRRERDLVFIDQRGTGDSHRLACSISGDLSTLQNYFREVFEAAAIRACRQKLEEGADLRFYTTPVAMDDMEEIRRALGYDKINLYAVSYGTVGALDYIRRYSGHMRSAALAGVVTPAAKLPLQFAQGAQRAMEKMLDDCAADEGCRSAFPRLPKSFMAALDAFANGPVRLELTRPQTRAKQAVTISRGVFLERLRLMLNDHASASLLPYLIHRAGQGDWHAFGNVAVRPASAPAYTLALGTYLSSTCSESVAFISDAEIKERTAGTFLGDYRVQRHRSACAEWPIGELSSDFLQPVKSHVPLLLLSGDLDPAAPAEFAKAAAAYLPNSRQVILRNTAHNYTSPCARSLTVEFFAKGSTDGLGVSCANGLRRSRFLTDLPERYR